MEPSTVIFLTNVGFAVMAVLFVGFVVAVAGVVMTLLARKWK